MTILEEAATKAREVLAKVRPGPLVGRRSLPIRADAADIERAWAAADGRAAVLDGTASRRHAGRTYICSAATSRPCARAT